MTGEGTRGESTRGEITRLLVSTVRRQCPPDEPSGYIYLVDLENQRVIKRCAIVEPLYRDLDNNPRGGMRGGKGIAVRDDQIALANFSRIFRYDPQWNLLGVISHPSCAGVHDILFKGDTLWVAAARADLLLQFDLSGKLLRHFYLRDPSPALDQLGWKPPRLLSVQDIQEGRLELRHPLNIEKESFDRAHLNSMGLLKNGDLLVSLGFVFGDDFAALLRLKIWLIRKGIWPVFKELNRRLRIVLGRKQKNMDAALVVKPAKAQSALVCISPEGKRSVLLQLKNMSAPSHSLLVLPDQTVIYLNTTQGEVIHFDPQACQVLSTTKITDGFLRGVTALSESTLLLGSQGELYLFDLPARKVLSSFKITDQPKEAVYDIKLLPEHYADPPDSFAEHFDQAMR